MAEIPPSNRPAHDGPPCASAVEAETVAIPKRGHTVAIGGIRTAKIAVFYVETEAKSPQSLQFWPASRVRKKAWIACTIESAVRSRHSAETSDCRSALFVT